MALVRETIRRGKRRYVIDITHPNAEGGRYRRDAKDQTSREAAESEARDLLRSFTLDVDGIRKEIEHEERKRVRARIREAERRDARRRGMPRVLQDREETTAAVIKRIANWCTKYGLDEIRAATMIANARVLGCGVCSRPLSTVFDMVLDHCHATGRVRGVLCIKCNSAIGALGDTPEGLQRAIDYLRVTE